MDHHLSGDDAAGNNRNGYGKKTVLTDSGKVEIAVPRDREASFDPQIIAKYQRRFPGFDESAAADDLGDHWASHLDLRARYEHPRDRQPGVRADGQKEVLGMWIEQNEGPNSGSMS